MTGEQYQVNTTDEDVFEPYTEVFYYIHTEDPEIEESITDFFEVSTDGLISLKQNLVDYPFVQDGLEDLLILPIRAVDNPNGDPEEPDFRQNEETIRMRLRKVVNYEPNYLPDELELTVQFDGKSSSVVIWPRFWPKSGFNF